MAKCFSSVRDYTKEFKILGSMFASKTDIALFQVLSCLHFMNIELK